MLFQLLHHDLDGFFQLRVMALSVSCGIKIDFNVRRDAMVFNLPLTVEAVNSRTGRGKTATIDQFRITADSNQTSPGLLANQRTDAALAKIPGQGVAARAGHFIDDHDLGPEDGFR